MKNKFTKLCVVCMVYACFAFSFMQTVFAETVLIDGVKYTYVIENETVEITAAYVKTNTTAIIPETIEGYPVTKIGGFDLEDFVNVVMPDTVTEMSDFAFNHCEKLKSVTLSQNLKEISYCAFTNCKELQTVNIPASVKIIGKAAFNYCMNLKEISLSENITEIGDGAFFGCKSVKSLNFPNGLTHIGKEAFFHCTQLQTLVIPKTVKSIGCAAFAQAYRDDVGSLASVMVSRTYNNICYTGSQEEWQKIKIDAYNTNLTNSDIKFNVPTCFVKINQNDKGTNVEVTPENLSGSVIITGAYKDDKMTFISIMPDILPCNTVLIPKNIDFDAIKVFVFDSITSINPQCSSVTRTFTLK